mmetsp:Transcript_17547/g.54823  ORF Transcript_17547/g.54823 Transcript_17547/m.54823 type:complete len:232 (-) Transcript_17547:48-743(-)
MTHARACAYASRVNPASSAAADVTARRSDGVHSRTSRHTPSASAPSRGVAAADHPPASPDAHADDTRASGSTLPNRTAPPTTTCAPTYRVASSLTPNSPHAATTSSSPLADPDTDSSRHDPSARYARRGPSPSARHELAAAADGAAATARGSSTPRAPTPSSSALYTSRTSDASCRTAASSPSLLSDSRYDAWRLSRCDGVDGNDDDDDSLTHHPNIATYRTLLLRGRTTS